MSAAVVEVRQTGRAEGPPDDPAAFRRWLLEDKTRVAEWLDELLSNEEAAAMTGYDPRSFANLRCRRRGPRFIKTPGRILYRRADVLRWLTSCVVGTNDDRWSG